MECTNCVGAVFGLVVKMIDGYDKPLHAPWQYKTMESPAQELDEVAIDAAIADLMSEENPDGKASEVKRRPEFPDLLPQEPRVARVRQQDGGAGSSLRQKLAQLAGAA